MTPVRATIRRKNQKERRIERNDDLIASQFLIQFLENFMDS